MKMKKRSSTSNDQRKGTFLIMAGGTGGHVFPGIVIANELVSRGYAIHWLGTPGGMEKELVTTHGFPISFISVKGVRGKGVKAWLVAPWRIILSTLQALSVMRRIKPKAVLGMGGFVSGPGGLAAKILGIPLIIHEQNAVSGMTNRLSAPMAKKILTGFPGVFEKYQKAVFTGNPVRLSIDSSPRKKSGYGTQDSVSCLRILVLGGSRGARFINRILPETLSLLPENISVWHQCGAGEMEKTSAHYLKYNVKAKVVPFIEDMAEAYGWADLVICRSGALTVAELANSGSPSILVPYPWHKDRQQFRNAQYLAEKNAAIIQEQDELNARKLASVIERLARDKRALYNMGQAALSRAKPGAAINIADICEETVSE